MGQRGAGESRDIAPAVEAAPPEAGRGRKSAGGSREPAGRDGGSQGQPAQPTGSAGGQHQPPRRIRRPPPPQRPGSCRRTGIPGRTASTSTASTIGPVRSSTAASAAAAGGWPGRKSVGGRSQLEGMEPEPGPAEKDKQTLSTPPRDITQKDPGGRFFKWGGAFPKPHRPPFSHAREFFSSLGEKKARTHYAHARARVDGGRICRAAGRDRLHLHRAPIRPVRPFLFSTKQRLFLFSARNRKKGRKSVGGRASKTAPPKKRARCQNWCGRVRVCA